MMSVMTYLSFGLEVLLPLYFVYHLWRFDVESRAA